MKWIKKRNTFLNEAKIRDIVLTRQAKEISTKWGSKFLDYEEIKPTTNIKQGQWKLTEEDKNDVLNHFFGLGSTFGKLDIERVFEIFKNIPEHFSNILLMSIDDKLLKEDYKIIISNNKFNINKPTIDQITLLTEPVFRKLSVNQTRDDNYIKKDQSGRPIRDSEGNMIKVQKEKGEPIYENNLVGISSFIDDYNRIYKDLENIDYVPVDVNLVNDYNIQKIISMSKENHNSDYKFDFEIFDRDMYLKIIHNPKDILNISISKFYASCQHLYTGSHRGDVLSNVFDPNTIPAFLYFDSDIYWGDEKISDFLPISRLFIRNIENEQKNLKIFFDKCYPDRLQNKMEDIIEKYSDNKETVREGTYLFAPDIDLEDEMRPGYHDRLYVETKKMIGVNAKNINLSRAHDWSKYIISPDAKIESIIIQTEELPGNFLQLNLKPDWVKFQYLTINTLKNFDKIEMKSVSFDKCQFSDSILIELNNINPRLEKMEILSSDFSSNIDLSIFKSLKELRIIYTISSLEQIKSMVGNLKLEKLAISGDLASSKEAKEFISDLKKKGTKIETIGPVM